MKPKNQEKSNMAGSDYHRRCHMAFTPAVVRTPKRTGSQNVNYEACAERDYNDHESTHQKPFIHDEIPVKGRRTHDMKNEKNTREQKAAKETCAERDYNDHESTHQKLFIHDEIPVKGRRTYDMKNEKNTREQKAAKEVCAERDFNDHESTHQKLFIQDEIPVKGRRTQDMKSEKNTREQKAAKAPHIVECYIDKNYINTPVATEAKVSSPIKKINFTLPNEKPEQNEDRMDWNNYHRLGVIHKFMDDLEYDFPSICTTGVIGTSLEGRNLKILKVSNSYANNASVWVDAGIHAREWIAPAVNTYIADHITRNFDNLPESIKNKDWYFLPVVNPDGYEYSHTNDRMWRKNRAWHGGQCVGVDLNRNFSYGWGGRGSSEQPNHAFYRGPQPFSEPESAAMRDVFLNSGVKFKVYITLHSYGQVIIFPYAYSAELAPDYIRLLEGATVMSKAIYNSNGNTYKVGISRDVMYGAAGTSNDFSYGAVGIPYCYLIELRSKKHKFRLPKEEIEETGNEILKCVIALMEFVDNYKPKRTTEDSEQGTDSEPKKNNFEVNRIASKEKRSDSFVRRSSSYVKRCDSDVDSSDTCDYTGDSFVKRKVSYVYKEDSFEETRDCYTTKNDSFMTTSNSFMQSDIQYKSYQKDVKLVSNVDICSGLLFFMVQFLKVTKRRRHTINIWKEEHSTMDVMVEGLRVAQVAGMLHEREIPYSIAVPDVNTQIEREQGSALSTAFRKNATGLRPIMDWKSYHRLDTIYAFMDSLAVEYPYLCQVSVIGKSVEGRDLKMVKISNGNESNSGVWLDGTIHPREWISPAVVTYIADRLVRTFHEQPDSVTNKDWYILPVMNPDGYEYTHTHDRMWRKNRAHYGECIGVDLNRNFSYGFGEKGEEGSSDDPGNIFYRGPQAFSEPETAAVRRVIVESPTTFKVFLSFHSYGEVIIFPWGYTNEPCPDYVELLEGGTAMAKAIHSTNGHTYKVGSTKDLMYYAAGTSIDWSYAVTNITYSYMVELRGKTHRFLLPKEEIISTSAEVLNGVFRLMDFVDRRCTGTQSCSCPK